MKQQRSYWVAIDRRDGLFPLVDQEFLAALFKLLERFFPSLADA
jgi:hypothetical protein